MATGDKLLKLPSQRERGNLKKVEIKQRYCQNQKRPMTNLTMMGTPMMILDN